ncbi:bifunctional metallophosphatase/5'-nucleotidase [Aequorivita sp. H23M31]|uniref:Bifunctional metallophosphatase/5'-nucleotidase n=1 Tax=Aequorivita ciconiae TaxID=2494375 RepID=A0A410G1J8_9FLAO|nr:bifunctional metallophosphatase/5'-nucleotidase [Aequorivita sp. H23M31]QAA81143.1 bifunctional metallophosphatase/5'-nucleotidase [Aequorivita sp. H23M31]
MKKLLLIAITGFFIGSCGVKKPAPQQTITGKESITLKFVQINDVYEIAPLNGGEYGGLERVGYIRDSIKQKFPNTYLFLAGDFLNPSLLGTLKVDGERLNGKQMVDVLNALDLDLVTFGNHEFDLKEKDLQKRLNESNFKWTSANVRHVTKSGTIPFEVDKNGKLTPVSDYESFTAIGPNNEKLKFGVFGVTLPSNPQDYVYYGDIYDDAKRAYNLAGENNEFVVGLTHVALEEDMDIAKRIPSLRLIMGGHEHNNMLEKQGSTIIAKADANAKSLYVHTLIYNPKNKNLTLNSELVMVTDKTPSSPKVARVVEKWTALMDSKLKEFIDNPDEVIYQASVPLDGTDDASRSKQTNLGEIIARSLAYAYGDRAQAGVVNGGSIRIDDKLSGDITSTDIFRILPFGGSSLLVDIKGDLLKKVLDYGMGQSGTGAYLQRYNISKDAAGAWQIGSDAIVDQKTYSIAFSDFLLKGLDIPFLTPDNPGIVKVQYAKEGENAADIRKAIISYLNSLKQ